MLFLCLFHRWKRVVHVWNDTRMIKWRQKAHFHSISTFFALRKVKSVLQLISDQGSSPSLLVRGQKDKHKHLRWQASQSWYYFQPFALQTLSPDCIPSRQNEPFIFTDATLNFWPDHSNASLTRFLEFCIKIITTLLNFTSAIYCQNTSSSAGSQ